MIFCPLAGTPVVTQGFGQNPEVYAQFGIDGHNGIDFDADTGTTVYAPHDGIATVVDDGEEGYGLHVIIEDAKRKSVLAHLSETDVETGQAIYQGDPIGLSGESGFVTAPHLHWTYKIMQNGQVQNRDNGYDGAMDVTEFTRLWLDQDLHHNATYTEHAQEYFSLAFLPSQYLENPARHV